MGFAEQADAVDALLLRDGRALARDGARARLRGQPTASGKPFVEVSGRKGLGVKADDLLDRLIETAGREVARAQSRARARTIGAAIAEAIAVAAVRYFLIKFSRGKVIAFDIDEALSFEGETGPVPPVRRRARQQHPREARRARRRRRGGRRRRAAVAWPPSALDRGRRGRRALGPGARGRAARRDRRQRRSDRSSCPSLAKYAFGLAQAFNAFYHRQPILQEEREDARLWRAAAVVYVRRQLTLALDLMGCDVPARM